MQTLAKSKYPNYKISIEFKDNGATIDAICWYGDGFNTPSNGGVIGSYTITRKSSFLMNPLWVWISRPESRYGNTSTCCGKHER
ncbi:MAG: hypothetical protein D3910_03875 [Candidatus Electrothrix sp. ATG2]|nr:hypothetical protein [Candidatus Electrothrix sp. ATG2]